MTERRRRHLVVGLQTMISLEVISGSDHPSSQLHLSNISQHRIVFIFFVGNLHDCMREGRCADVEWKFGLLQAMFVVLSLLLSSGTLAGRWREKNTFPFCLFFPSHFAHIFRFASLSSFFRLSFSLFPSPIPPSTCPFRYHTLSFIHTIFSTSPTPSSSSDRPKLISLHFSYHL